MSKIQMILGAALLATITTLSACSKQVLPPQASDMEKASKVCSDQGKTLASYEEKGYDFKFTCE